VGNFSGEVLKSKREGKECGRTPRLALSLEGADSPTRSDRTKNTTRAKHAVTGPMTAVSSLPRLPRRKVPEASAGESVTLSLSFSAEGVGMAAKRVSKGKAGRARGALKRGEGAREIRVQAASAESTLELTSENVEQVLDEVRPYLIADGGEVEVADVDALTVYLRLKGACGSCPSSAMTLKMGIERRYAFWSQETVQYLLSSLLRLFRMIRWNEMRCAHD